MSSTEHVKVSSSAPTRPVADNLKWLDTKYYRLYLSDESVLNVYTTLTHAMCTIQSANTGRGRNSRGAGRIAPSVTALQRSSEDTVKAACSLAPHICVAPSRRPNANNPLLLAHRCAKSWSRLTDRQRDIIEDMERSVNATRAERNHYVSIFNIDGIGGCGKTRIMSYLCNHRDRDTIVLYLAKQNKRVQEFIHVDSVGGEIEGVTPPSDLSRLSSGALTSMMAFTGGMCGATTADRLLYTLGYTIHSFERNVSLEELRIPTELDLAALNKHVLMRSGSINTVLLLIDEQTMLSPPMVHAMIYNIFAVWRRPVVALMCGDTYQCGTIGWDREVESTYYHYSTDTMAELERHFKIAVKRYEMKSIQRCKADPYMAKLVYVLRSLSMNHVREPVVKACVLNFCYRKRVALYLQNDRGEKGAVEFDNGAGGDADGGDSGPTEGVNSLKLTPENMMDYDSDDEFDRAVNLVRRIDTSRPPSIDMLPYVNAFVDLYIDLYDKYKTYVVTRNENNKSSSPSSSSTKRGRYSLGARPDDGDRMTAICNDNSAVFGDFVNRSFRTYAKRAFPVIITQTNDACNQMSDAFIDVLYSSLVDKFKSTLVSGGNGKDGVCEDAATVDRWLGRMTASLPIDSCTFYKRQNLMVGMVYKVTQMLKSADDVPFTVHNGEQVVLTFIRYHPTAAESVVESVSVRRLMADDQMDYVITPGHVKSRLTKGMVRTECIFPLVPYVCENIYQMQGTTLGKENQCYIDITTGRLKEWYVALSRFQSSASIRSIVMNDLYRR